MNTWITSDLHFCHDKPFLYEPRGFTSIQDHDKAIIKNWNEIVEDEDLVYVLGDLMLNNNALGCSQFNQLKGLKVIILGNHDTEARVELYKDLRGVIDIGWATKINYEGFNFFLSHYPALTRNFNDKSKPLHKRIISLCGHSHTSDRFADWDKGCIYHCELDAHNNAPILLDNVIEDLRWKVNE